MNEYILKLSCLGFPAHEAYRIWWDFMKNYGKMRLDEYIEELEREYVDRV